MAGLAITPVPCLRDNYCYLLQAPGSKDAWLVDPSEPDPPLAALRARGLELRGVLATHHHPDHVGGVPGLLRRFPEAFVAGHERDRGRIPLQTHFVSAPANGYAPSGLHLGPVPLLALHVPGHTLGAIAWQLPAQAAEPADVFTGDTLFAAGCGRLFEGTPAMMFRSLRAMTDLPEEARLWFGHEYTAANLAFAAVAEPDNPAIEARRARLGPVTTPTTVAEERATNPFLRARDAQELARLRRAKDEFRG